MAWSDGVGREWKRSDDYGMNLCQKLDLLKIVFVGLQPTVFLR